MHYSYLVLMRWPRRCSRDGVHGDLLPSRGFRGRRGTVHEREVERRQRNRARWGNSSSSTRRRSESRRGGGAKKTMTRTWSGGSRQATQHQPTTPRLSDAASTAPWAATVLGGYSFDYGRSSTAPHRVLEFKKRIHVSISRPSMPRRCE